MFKLFKEFYLIQNFPEKYSWYKKILSNLGFLFSRIIIHPRKNKLTFRDLLKADFKLRKGDIILCGERQTIFSEIIGDPVNHAVIYIGRRRFVEAIGKGVRLVSFHKLFTEYHNYVILRTVKGTKRKIIKAAIRWAKEQVGRPYNYEFSKNHNGYFCSELVNEAYRSAGYETKLISISPPKSLKRKIRAKISSVDNALRPARMIRGNFRIISLSHNLKLKGKTLVAIE